MYKVRSDLEGRVYGRVTVISYSHTKNGHAYWNLKCTCGNTHIASSGSLKIGYVKSCGCLRREATRLARKKHGESHTKLAYCWAAMRSRCRGTDPRYRRLYTERGIKVCDEWNDYTVFKRDMAPTYKDGLELDRIDNNKGYSKENCRWATRQQQVVNSRPCRPLTINNTEWTLKKYCKKYDLNYLQYKSMYDKGLFIANTTQCQ